MTWSRVMVLALLLLGFGWARQPVEEDIAATLEARHFREATLLPDGPMREKLGQLGAAAALGGFRSFLATLYELRAISAYSQVDYEAVASLYNVTTQLQPREPGYWGMAAWMMDSNARRYYLSFDREHSRREQEVLARLSVERGRQFLLDGLRYNPDSYELHRSLGNHYALRMGDFCRAAEAFARAAALREEPGAAARHHLIYLAQCPGNEREAYVKLRALVEAIRRGETELPTPHPPPALLLHLRYLETVLRVPEADRLPMSFDFAELYDRLRSHWRPGVRYEPLQRMRLHRLEEILEIPRGQRIPSDEPLAPSWR